MFINIFYCDKMKKGDNMRIIAGTLRGRTIKAVPGNSTRPTLDKVKESVFNVIGQYFDDDIILDLFAGSGNLGIEAISRGAKKCVFIEKDYHAYKIINENIDLLKISDQCEVFKMDANSALDFLKNKGYSFDYIFLDPPYKKQKINETIINLVDKNLLNDNAKIIVECLKEDELIDEYQGLRFLKQYIYGITKISIFEKYGDRDE